MILKNQKKKKNISLHLDDEEHMEEHSLWHLQEEAWPAEQYSHPIRRF